MDWSNPFRALAPTIDGDVLSVLAAGDVRMSGRQVASRIPSRSHEGVRLALARLVQQGVVRQGHVGRSSAFELNREHVLAPAILEIASTRSRVMDRIAAAISEWSELPYLVVLFGSVVRGTASSTSDVDVLVVRDDDRPDDPAWDEQLLSLQLAIHRMTGNDARLLEYGRREFAAVQEGAVVEAIEYGVPVAGSMSAARRLRRGSS